MIDYKLAKEIGATHWHTGNFDFYKEDCGELLAYTDGKWRQSLITTANAMLLLRPIPPKRTSTEYEKVTESIFDLRDEFERGELYKLRNDDTYEKITCESKLGELYGYRLIYRKVEKEVDWTVDVIDFLSSELQGGERVIDADVELFCDGSKFINLNVSLPKNRFLELCRVALRANGEIE